MKTMTSPTYTFLLLALCGCFATSFARAEAGAILVPIPAQYVENDPLVRDPGTWSAEVSTGIEFSNVRVSHNESSTEVPAKISAVYTIDEVSNEQILNGILRGHTDFLFSGFARPIFDAREHHIYGFQAGPRYNFVQKGWKVVPFIESEVGLGFADSNGRYSVYQGVNQPSGLGQDFNFTFAVGAGLKFRLSEWVYSRIAIKFVHFSNAGLSEPGRRNEGIDAMGPEFSLGFQF